MKLCANKPSNEFSEFSSATNIEIYDRYTFYNDTILLLSELMGRLCNTKVLVAHYFPSQVHAFCIRVSVNYKIR